MINKKADSIIKFLLEIDTNNAVHGIENAMKSGDDITKKFQNVGRSMTTFVTLPLTKLASAGIEYNATLETYTANLTTLLQGNEKQAKQLLSDLKAMANTTPFETTSLVKATQTMLGFGIQLKDSQKYLKQLGDISMGDSQKLDGLTLAFSQVQSAGKLAGQDLLQMINQGFNPLNIISQKTGESIASLKERMGEGKVSAQEVAQALEWATEEGGLFYGAMDKASQTTEGKLSTLKDEFNSALGELTTSLLPVFTQVVDKLTQMAKWFGNLSDSQKKTLITVVGVVAAIGPLLMILSKVIGIVKTLIGVFKVIKTAMIAINAVMMANPIVLIIAAIVALIAIIVLLYKKCEPFRNFINSMISGIIGFIQNLFTTIGNVASAIWNVITSIASAIWNFLRPIFDFIKNAIILYVAIVTTVISAIYNVLVSIGSWIWNNVLSPVINFIKTCVGFVWNLIVQYYTFVFNLFMTIATWIYSNVLSPIINFFKSAFEFIWGIVNGVINKIKSAFQTVANVVRSVFGSVKSFISNIFSTIAGVIKAPINGVIGLINNVLRAMNKIKVPDWVPGLGGKGVHFSMIPKLNTGTNYIQHEGLAYLHKGEAVVPKKYNPAVGGANQPIYVNVQADMDVDKFGNAFVREIKTFSGGAKQSYNY